MKKHLNLFAVAAASVLLAPLAIADSYINAELNQTRSEVAEDFCDIGAGVPGVRNRCNDDDTGFRVAYGYAFNSNFALEIGYADMGSFKASASDDVNFIDAKLEVKGFDVVAIGRLPINDTVALTGRAGALFWDTELGVESNFGLGSQYNESASGESLLLGVGAEFTVSDATAITLNYEQAKDVGDENKTGEGDVDRLSLGLKVRF